MTATLESVLKRHAEAVGGVDAIQSLHSVEIDFHLVEPNLVVDGLYAADRSGHVRVDIMADGLTVFAEGLDGGRAWQWSQGSAEPYMTSEEGAEAMLHGIHNQLYGIHELPSLGYALELEDSRIGDPYLTLRVRAPGAHVVRRHMNPKTFLVELAQERKSLHPDVDSTKTMIETRYSDFRSLSSGLIRPFREVQVARESGMTLATTTVQNIAVNPEWPADRFEPPS